MIDVLTYCPDTTALVSELREKYPERLGKDDPENPTFLIDKTPTVRKGAETLALVRCRDGALEMLEALTSITVLGTYDGVLTDEEKIKIHKRIYPRTMVKYTDDEGVEHSHKPPERIGAFA